MSTSHSLAVALILLSSLFTPSSTAGDGSTRTTKDHNDNNHGGRVGGIVIGAIVDRSSRTGKEEMAAMEIAKKDIFRYSNRTVILHVRYSRREAVGAALAAMDLINEKKVQAIIGPQTWEELPLVAEIGSQNQVPILSLAGTAPEWATEKWPFLLEASSPNKSAQMKAIAAIVQSWNLHQVTVIHQDGGSFMNEVTTHLHFSLKEVGAEISQFVSLSSFASSDLISKDLENLKREQCRVFIVHLSFPLAARLFESAKKMKMMEKDYVWITTDHITSLVHATNASMISSMQGIVGVKSYFPENQFQDFSKRFRERFRRQNPEEENSEPGIHAVLAYDAMLMIAQALHGSSMRNHEFLEKILQSDFHGLSGKVQFNNQKTAPAQIFQIINVMGKSYRELGFWSNLSGFSEAIGSNAAYSPSMNDLGQVLWPGGPWYTPKGWTNTTTAKPLRVGVPARSGYREYVKVAYNQSGNETFFSGLALELFKATVERLPFYLPCEFKAFNDDSYDNLVDQIRLQEFDAVVGDVAIIASRYRHAEFSHPFTETGLMLIVPTRSSKKQWSFIKPFTKSMWASIVTITIYNGFVVWLIERGAHPALRGSLFHQIGILLWLSFNTLFSLDGGKLHSNLSRMSMLLWLFVGLVVIQTYTANLTSMLTVQRLEPTVTSVEALVETNAMVGSCSGSYVKDYLAKAYGFPSQNVKNYGSAQAYAEAFNNKEIVAAFMGTPVAKIFLATYCKRFMNVGPTINVGGFGFAFPRGSPLLASINEALLNASENGTLRQLENQFIGVLQKCPDKEDEDPSLSPNGFQGLFIITASTSTIALVIYMFCLGNSMTFQLKTIWGLMLAVMKHWSHRRRRLSGRVSDAAAAAADQHPDENPSSDNAPNLQLSQV